MLQKPHFTFLLGGGHSEIPAIRNEVECVWCSPSMLSCCDHCQSFPQKGFSCRNCSGNAAAAGEAAVSPAVAQEFLFLHQPSVEPTHQHVSPTGPQNLTAGMQRTCAVGRDRALPVRLRVTEPALLSDEQRSPPLCPHCLTRRRSPPSTSSRLTVAPSQTLHPPLPLSAAEEAKLWRPAHLTTSRRP